MRWTLLQVAAAVALLALVSVVQVRYGIGWATFVFVLPTLIGGAVIAGAAVLAHRERRRRLLEQEFRE